MHVHVSGADGEAKFWLEPTISLATQAGLRASAVIELQTVVEENADAFRDAWREHFRG